jgi:hypothetical protein
MDQLPAEKYPSAAQFVAELVEAEPRRVDRILIRPIGGNAYAGQYWVFGEKDPEIFTVVTPDAPDQG